MDTSESDIRFPSYQVETESGITLQCHVDQLCIRYSSDQPTSDDNYFDDWLTLDMEHSIPTAGITDTASMGDLPLPSRRSTHERRPVDRYTHPP